MELLSMKAPATQIKLVVYMLTGDGIGALFNSSGRKPFAAAGVRFSTLPLRLPANADVTTQSSLPFTGRDDQKYNCVCRLLPSWPL